ncbi:MAG: hypothetical protein IJ197_06880 [Bacteroidaceae bacterium]|nr:hypothetical protein [Bacteroidaceae bacterium]
MRNKKFVSLTSCLVIASIIPFMSCSNDDDFLMESDLSLNSQVPLITSESDQSGLELNYNEYSYGENECCIIAFVEMKKREMPNHNFNSGYSATDCYNNVMDDAKGIKDEDGNSMYNGGAMDLEVFLELGKKYNAFNERQHFNSEDEIVNYFSNTQNRPKMIQVEILNKKTGLMEPHVGYVTNIYRNSGKVSYALPGGGAKTVDMSEIKDVWY